MASCDRSTTDKVTPPGDICTELHAKLNLKQQGIPQDIAMKLFSKLSIKDLVRFKSVSKHWDRIISDPFFGKTYVANSALKNWLLFLEFKQEGVARIAQLRIPEKPDQTCEAKTKYGIPLPDQIIGDVKILGYADGLLCISGEHGEILLYNPSTRECRDLNRPNDYSGRRRVYYLAGIGYDKSTSDYKVVAVFFEGCSSRENNKVMVFSLRENSWREAKPPSRNPDFPYSIMCNDTHRVPVNGAIHWFVRDRNRSQVIVAFDLATEEVKEIPLPDHGDYAEAIARPKCKVELGALGGRLALMLHNQYDERREFYVEVWLMEEYGVSSSWVRQGLRDTFYVEREVKLRTPICCWKGPTFLCRKGDRVWIGNVVGDVWQGNCIWGNHDFSSEWIGTPMGFRNTLIAFSPNPASPYGLRL